MYKSNLKLYDSLFPGHFIENSWLGSTSNLKVDIAEDDKSYQVTADVPGFEKKDLEVSFDDHILTLAGKVSESKDEKSDVNGNQKIYTERYQSEFKRSFRFTKDIDAQKIKAKVADGVLTVILSKVDQKEVNKSKLITIE